VNDFLDMIVIATHGINTIEQNSLIASTEVLTGYDLVYKIRNLLLTISNIIMLM